MRVTADWNLAVVRPDLALQWHSSNSVSPLTLAPSSGKRATWQCSAGHVWDAVIANRVRLGRGCPYCSGQLASPTNNFAVMNPSLVKEWSDTNTLRPEQVTPSSKTRIQWVCSMESEHMWEAPAADRTSGQGCPYCAGKRPSKKNNFAAARPELVSEWSTTRNDRSPSDVTIWSSFQAWWVCPLDPTHEWQTQVYVRSKGHGCPFCSGVYVSAERALSRTHLILSKEWSAKNIVTLEEVSSGSDYLAWWKCSENAEHPEWQAAVYSRASGKGCPYCSGHRPSEENNLAIDHPDLLSQWGSENSFLPTEVTSGSKRIAQWVCPKDKNHVWWTAVQNRTAGAGCHLCSRHVSKGQVEVADFLKSLGLPVVSGERRLLSGWEIDALVPEYNLGIEYCGLRWHSESFKPRDYHLEKLTRAQTAGIRLVTLFEHEWISRKAVVKAFLSSMLGRFVSRIGARKTQIEALSWGEASAFLDAHHIQGASVRGQILLGLRLGTDLVAVMVCQYSKPRHAGPKEPRWELTRYCVRSGYQVIGGFQKLWSRFIETVRPDFVVSFSDRRWSEGGLYLRSGFTKDGSTAPSYTYFVNGKSDRVFHKSLFQRSRIESRLGPILSGETEYDAMKRFGFDRIWDCGLDRWVWRP